MKKKFISSDFLLDFWGDLEWEILPLDKSPFPSIKLPPSYEFVTVSGSQSMMSYCSGPSIVVAGMDVFRSDLKDYPYLINADHYSIYSTPDKTLFEIVKNKPGYHWIKSIQEIPVPIYESLPTKTKSRIEELLNSDYTDIIGLGVDKKMK